MSKLRPSSLFTQLFVAHRRLLFLSKISYFLRSLLRSWNQNHVTEITDISVNFYIILSCISLVPVRRVKSLLDRQIERRALFKTRRNEEKMYRSDFRSRLKVKKPWKRTFYRASSTCQCNFSLFNDIKIMLILSKNFPLFDSIGTIFLQRLKNYSHSPYFPINCYLSYFYLFVHIYKYLYIYLYLWSIFMIIYIHFL